MSHEELNSNNAAHDALRKALELSFFILKLIMVLLVTIFLCSGFFIVEQNEVALVMRFGNIVGSKVNRELKPGPHWSFPFPISKIVRINKKTQFISIEDFWYYEDPDLTQEKRRRKAGKTLAPDQDGYCLTNDANIVHVEKIQVRYNIKDAYNYIMYNKNPRKLLHNIILDATIKTIASFSVNDARKKTDELISLVKKKAQQRLENLKSGIKITNISLRIIPPLNVQDAFDSVIQAEARQLKEVEAAKSYKTKLENETKAEVHKIIEQAKNLKKKIIQDAQSDAKYLQSIASRFKKTPDIYREIHYNKMLEEISSDIEELFFFPASNNRELRIRTNRDPELQKFKAPEGQEPDIDEGEK